jgi:hypothetical protein
MIAGKYDLIGDIHGHAEVRRRLCGKWTIAMTMAPFVTPIAG